VKGSARSIHVTVEAGAKAYVAETFNVAVDDDYMVLRAAC
jgi:hypothetical protein